MLLPVLAGYWFLSRTHVLKRAYTDDKSNYELFFASAIFGVAFFVVGWLLVALLGVVAPHIAWLAGILDLWREVAPFNQSDAIALAIGIAFVSSRVTNAWITDKEAAARWASENESRMGWIFRESLERRQLLEVSLTNGKSYVGFVVDQDPRGWEQDVALLPVLSGYRNTKTKRLVLTKNYAASRPRSLEDYAVVLPTNEVVSVCRFDVSVHRDLTSRGMTSSA